MNYIFSKNKRDRSNTHNNSNGNEKNSRGVERNISLEYAYTFLRNLDMSNSVWVLYLAFRGMSLWQIGLLEGVYHVTSMVCEIPSGAAADLLGRKRTVVWGRVCIVISCILMLICGSFWGFAIAFVIQALGNNLNSGSEEALVYDSMKQCGREEEYLKVNSRVNILVEISQAIATVAGGVLAEISYVWCYGQSAVLAGMALIPALLMREPECGNKVSENDMTEAQKAENGTVKGRKISILEHFRISGRILTGSREIRNVLLYYSMVFVFHTVLFFYSQQYFYELGLNRAQIGMVMLLAGGAACLGALFSERWYNRLGERIKYPATLVISFCLAGFFLENLMLSVALFMTANFANSLLYPIQSISLNRLIPSEQRATLISVSSMLFSVGMAAIFPIAGVVADMVGLPITFLILGILMAITTKTYILRESLRK